MKASILMVMMSLATGAPAVAGTFVYVSNAEDGDIGLYTLQADGSLKPGERVKAAKLVMPMTVSPDKRFLIAAVRSKPFQAYSYSIDKSSGALTLVGKPVSSYLIARESKDCPFQCEADVRELFGLEKAPAATPAALGTLLAGNGNTGRR